MATITITEALAELKTIQKRLETRRHNVLEYIARDARLKDPFEKSGGSSAHINAERQGITDLERRVVLIRTAIQQSNLATQLTLGGSTQSVADWLTWRREVASGSKLFMASMVNGIRAVRAEMQKRGLKAVTATEENPVPGDIVVNVNEKDLLSSQETIEQLLGDLDGKLSLLNATTTISV